MSMLAFTVVALIASWQLLEWGAAGAPDRAWSELRYRGRTTYVVLDDSLGTRLRAESRGTHSALVQRLREDQTLKRLRWRWRVLASPAGADPRTRKGDDRAAAVFVLVQRSVLPWRTRGLLYQWASAPPTGEWVSSPYARHIRVLTLRREAAGPGWHEEERDIEADLIAAFGQLPEAIEAVGVICDTDNTRGHALAEFGALECQWTPRERDVASPRVDD